MGSDYADSGPPSSPTTSKRVRLSRVSRACSECRVRKTRCDGLQPCTPCQEFERSKSTTTINYSRSHHSASTDCKFMSTRKQKVPGPSRTKILEDRHRRAKALVTRLHAQYPDLELGKKLSDIFDSPPASPDPQWDIRGTSDYTPSSGVPDTIDDKPGSASNQLVSGRHGDNEIDEIVTDGGPRGSTPPPSIGEDQRWMVKKDYTDHNSLFIGDQQSFNFQSLSWSMTMQPQGPFSEPVTLCSQTAELDTIPGSIECHIEGSTWPHGGTSGHWSQLPAHNHWPFFEEMRLRNTSISPTTTSPVWTFHPRTCDLNTG